MYMLYEINCSVRVLDMDMDMDQVCVKWDVDSEVNTLVSSEVYQRLDLSGIASLYMNAVYVKGR